MNELGGRANCAPAIFRASRFLFKPGEYSDCRARRAERIRRDGVPTDAAGATVYDNLDRIRGMEVFLENAVAASMVSVRNGLADDGQQS